MCEAHDFEYPHFRFVRADIYNKFYSPSGGVQARNFNFPYGATVVWAMTVDAARP